MEDLVKLTYRGTAALLARLHHIAPEKEGAFGARLKHFQRLGFPEGINTGKGTAASYGSLEVLEMALALELVQLGLTPERTVNLFVTHRGTMAEATQVALPSIRAGEWDQDVFLVLDPTALQSLSEFHTPGDMAGVSFRYERISGVQESLGIWTGARGGIFTRLALINLSSVIQLCHNELPPDEEQSQPVFYDELEKRCQQVIKRGPPYGRGQ